MAQDYYFNSHNPNNSNHSGNTPPEKRPPQKNKVGQKRNPPNGQKPPMRQKRPGSAAASGSQRTAPARHPAPGTVPPHGNTRSGSRPDPRRPAASVLGQQSKRAPGGSTGGSGKTGGMSKTKLNILRVVFGSFVICAFTGLVVGLTMLIYSINFVNGEMALDLDTAKYAQAQTTFIYGTNAEGQEIELARLHGTENRIWVDMENMSPYMKEAFIALEDKRFEKHSGVDWFRTISAVVVHGGSQGGSTITQQLIKNLTDQNSVTFVRKFNEILTALNLEKHFEKDEIIEAYLNTIYLSQGCYGVETAAITYFGKDISELNLAECASLAAITQFPSRYDPLRSSRTVTDEDGNERIIDYVEENRKRQKICLDAMLEQKKISQQEYDEAIAYKLVFTNSPEYKGKSAAATALTDKTTEEKEYNSYYVDFVIQQIADELSANEGITARQALKQIKSGGYKIYTAMDYTVQKTLEDVYENYTSFLDKEAQSSMTVMDYHGRVVGIVGGAGVKSGDMVLNRASQSTRPPGSTIKPLAIYAPALELNAISWSTLFSDSASRKSEEQPLVKGSGWPHNDHNEGGGGNRVTVQYALARSLNTVPVRILTDIGFEASKTFLEQKAHLRNLIDVDAAYGPLALGSLSNGATTLEMTAAYQMFGNSGYYYKPYAYTKVVNSRNEIVLESKPEETKEQVLSPANATVMNKMLQTVVGSQGSGSRFTIGSGYEMIAKTGTTTGSKDRWFVAGTPYYVAAVWYGYDEPRQIVADYNPAGAIWQTVMKRVHQAKDLASAKFESSSDAVLRKYCTITGYLASNSCGSTLSGWYDSDNLPGYCKGGHGSSSSDTNNSGSNTNSNQNSGTQTPETPVETTDAPPVTETPGGNAETPSGGNAETPGGDDSGSNGAEGE